MLRQSMPLSESVGGGYMTDMTFRMVLTGCTVQYADGANHTFLRL